jgi:orotidine-5'-phosphate decarboxylase
MQNLTAKDRLIVALDVDSTRAALALFEQTQRFAGTYKIGLELFTALGPSIVKTFRDASANVFLDLKLHDIPNTVASAIKRAAEHGVQMVTLHALGGPKMLQSANLALSDLPSEVRPKLLAVSVLTHHDAQDLQAIGFQQNPSELAVTLLDGAYASGLRGAVCSPLELRAMRARFGSDMTLVAPGVRPSGADLNDQARVATPFDAIKDGADYLVVGRPITRASSPTEAAKQIHDEIEEALHAKSS